jgi:hypothetical protein
MKADTPMRHGRARTACTVLIAFIVLGLAREARSQPCPAVTGDFSQQAVLTMKTLDNSCTIPDGGYVKVNTQVRLHVQSQVTGWCKIYFRNPQGFCQQLTIYNRLAANSSLRMDGGSTGQYPVLGNLNVQNYNTCAVVGGQCTSVNTLSQGATWLAHSSYGLGPHVYTSVNRAGGGTIGNGAQFCNMSGFQFPEEDPITVNVLKCEPKWALDSNNNIMRIDTSDTIDVYLPPGMAAAGTELAAALADWENRVGVEFLIVSAPCSGNSCINIAATPLDSCGYAPGGVTNANGIRVGASTLQLDVDWSAYSAEGLRRTFVHELGHLFGLADSASAPTCAIADAAMQDQFNCGASGVMDDVTINDYLPVTNTAYGGGTRLTCGF